MCGGATVVQRNQSKLMRHAWQGVVTWICHGLNRTALTLKHCKIQNTESMCWSVSKNWFLYTWMWKCAVRSNDFGTCLISKCASIQSKMCSAFTSLATKNAVSCFWDATNTNAPVTKLSIVVHIFLPAHCLLCVSLWHAMLTVKCVADRKRWLRAQGKHTFVWLRW